jgi:hypothetical protein
MLKHLTDYCEEYIEKVNSDHAFPVNKIIYEYCFRFIRGTYNVAIKDELNNFFNTEHY